MIYTDLLNKTIENSGLKNIEIVEKLKEKTEVVKLYHSLPDKWFKVLFH